MCSDGSLDSFSHRRIIDENPRSGRMPFLARLEDRYEPRRQVTPKAVRGPDQCDQRREMHVVPACVHERTSGSVRCPCPLLHLKAIEFSADPDRIGLSRAKADDQSRACEARPLDREHISDESDRSVLLPSEFR